MGNKDVRAQSAHTAQSEQTAEAARSGTDDGPGRFVDEIIERDLADGAYQRGLMTRFPPEPNGFLHIGHAKSIVLNFSLAEQHGGLCNLRFDDTNPVAEDTAYVDAIRRDVAWLGYSWDDREYYASDYFERLYAIAEDLVERGLAYVDSQSLEEIREGRGDFYRPGIESPHRGRSVEENLALLRGMRAGEFADGEHVLRAKIDMQSKDLKLRDPLIYRIRKVDHHRTGDAWPIYPMYDFAHGLSDAIEGVTHSICTLEFQNHRGLYEWFLEAARFEEPPKQIEFARLNLSYTVLSKRKLKTLVDEGHVAGWDDPRMPTLSGMRRRGIPAKAIREFCDRIGVSKRDGVVDVTLFEHGVRAELNATSPRYMAVLDPIELVITNFPEGQTFTREAALDPEDESKGTRTIHLGSRVYVERDDFMEEPMKKWFRLAPGREVRLRYGCLVTCERFEKDDEGRITRLYCTWDPESLGGKAPDGRRVRGTIHWVNAENAIPAEARLYDRLFTVENPAGGETPFTDHLNPEAEVIRPGARLEAALGDLPVGSSVQFERLGYFRRDEEDAEGGRPRWNRAIALRDGWAKIKKKAEAANQPKKQKQKQKKG